MKVLVSFNFQWPVPPFGELAGVRRGYSVAPHDDAIELYYPDAEGKPDRLLWLQLSDAVSLRDALNCAIAVMEAAKE